MQVYNATEWTNMCGEAASLGPPQVGDFREGGVVFYVAPTPTDLNGDGTLDQGLVCAIEDQSSGIQWWNGAYTTTGATGTDIGTGQTNTTAIVNNQGAGNYAASICDNYSVTIGATTYDDWFFPSINELNSMYQNRATINATALANGGSTLFASGFYWSSTEAGLTLAVRQDFSSSGAVSNNGKPNTNRVRAIRAF